MLGCFLCAESSIFFFQLIAIVPEIPEGPEIPEIPAPRLWLQKYKKLVRIMPQSKKYFVTCPFAIRDERAAAPFAIRDERAAGHLVISH